MRIRSELSAFAPGRWVMFPADFVPLFKLRREQLALILAEIINLCDLEEDEEGWTKVSNSYLRKKLWFYSPQQLSEALRIYRGMRLVETKVKGLPARRFIQVNVEELKRRLGILRESNTGRRLKSNTGRKLESNTGRRAERIPPYRGESSPKKNLEAKELTPAGDRRGNGVVDEKVWLEMSQRLRNSIHTHVKSVSTLCDSKKWTAYFRALHKTDKVPIPRIQEVLDWYCETLKEQGSEVAGKNSNYIPVAFSGRSFREKFPRLEQAMTRTRGSQGPRVSKQRIEDDPKPTIRLKRKSEKATPREAERLLDELDE